MMIVYLSLTWQGFQVLCRLVVCQDDQQSLQSLYEAKRARPKLGTGMPHMLSVWAMGRGTRGLWTASARRSPVGDSTG